MKTIKFNKKGKLFTGFKDANGEEIYNGDFIGDFTEVDGEMKQSKQLVFWSDKRGCWRLDHSFDNDKSLSTLLYKELNDFDYFIIKPIKIYISGAITGNKNAFKEFEAAEQFLNKLNYQVVNPMKLNHDHDKSWISYMRVCIQALCECDEIFMLKGWKKSKGAIKENNIAFYLSLPMMNRAEVLNKHSQSPKN